jgi:hypothetical protein
MVTRERRRVPTIWREGYGGRGGGHENVMAIHVCGDVLPSHGQSRLVKLHGIML